MNRVTARPAAGHPGSDFSRNRPSTTPAVRLRRDMLLVGGVALCLRLVFSLAVANTYDYDEFVILQLSRDLAHGATPYHDFMFFHPPGVLVLNRVLEPLTSIWWPLARLAMAVLDAVTAVLVYRIGALVWSRREGLAAGLVYALSPLALVASVRVGQDPLITALGVLGLYLLFSRPGWEGGVGAGVCLALALWIKYPAAYFLPVYVLAAPRRALIVVTSALAALGVLFLPFHAHLHELYDQTVVFQRTRWLMPTDQRVETTLLFWLAVNPLALPALIRKPKPLWLLAAFLLGGAFVFTSQVYYHYFVVVVPFAALASARLLATLSAALRRGLLALAVVALAGWAALLNWGGSAPLYVTAAHLSDVARAVSVIEQETAPGEPVLGDQLEYAYLARRDDQAHYFWNIGVLVNAAYLERRLPRRGAVVLSYGASSGYPAGFLRYLDARYRRIDTGSSTVWIIRPPG